MEGVAETLGEVMGCPLVLETSETGLWRKPSFFRGRWSLAGY